MSARSFLTRDLGINSNRAEWCTFFTQHRKYGYTVILVSQFDRLIDRQIRSLIEYEYKHRKINNYKAFGAVLGLFSGGALFVAVIYWYGVKERVGAEFFPWKAEILQSVQLL